MQRDLKPSPAGDVSVAPAQAATLDGTSADLMSRNGDRPQPGSNGDGWPYDASTFPYGLVPGAGLETRGPAIRRALEVIGLRWNLLILREVFRGVYRFQDLQRNLEISRKTLARRLEMLVAHEILERRRYEPRTDRYEYWPTRKGSDLRPVLMTLASWGERYASPPRRLGRHDSNEDVQSANGQSVLELS